MARASALTMAIYCCWYEACSILVEWVVFDAVDHLTFLVDVEAVVFVVAAMEGPHYLSIVTALAYPVDFVRTSLAVDAVADPTTSQRWPAGCPK